MLLKTAALLLGLSSVFLRWVSACTVLEFTDEGFSRNVLWLLHGYTVYAANGTFYLDASQWPFQCSETGGWGDFFATGDSLLPNWTPEVKGENGEDCVRIGAQSVNEILQTLNTGTAELDGMALEKLWKLQPWAQQQVNTTLRELKGLKGPTVAFHVRGGDLLADLTNNKRPMATPASMVERALEAFGAKAKGGTCLILGDDQELMAEAAKAAKRRLGCSIHRRAPSSRKTGYIQREFIAQPLEDRCKQTVQLLQDIHLMMHADYFVGSFDSQLPKLIEVLRFALLHKNKRNFADASARREDWYEAVRQYFKEQNGDQTNERPRPSMYAALHR